MSDRATCWSVTINNPISADDDNIARAKQKSGWKVEGQLEEGENGTQHYQLMVKTPQTRFSTIKSAFPRAHIEVARNVKALQSYVHKDDTKIAELPANDKFPSMDKFWLLFHDYILDKMPNCEWAEIDGEEWLPVLDKFVSSYIMKGYHIESFGVNPQIRSSIKKYGSAIFQRSVEIVRRQKSDRQTKLITEVNFITEDDNSFTDEQERIEEETCSQTTSNWSSEDEE